MPRGIRRVVVFVFLGVAPALAQLPPEILADQYLLQADQQITRNDHEGALESLQKILALQKEHGLTLPQAFHFKYAQVAFAAGSFPAALESVNQYLVAAGREGEFYQKALELLLAIKAAADRTPCAGQPKGAECWLELANQAGCYLWNPEFQPYKTVTWSAECTGGLAQGAGTLKWAWNTGDKLYRALKTAEKTETPSAPQLRAGTPSTFRDEPTCAGQPKGTACWMEVADQSGCYLWNPNLQVDATVTWTGECVEGLAQGTGTGKWVYDSGEKTQENTGHLEDGRRHGQWVIRFASGTVWEGPYEAGRWHGQWVFRIKGWGVGGGPYVDDKRHGPWILTDGDGGKWEGSFEEGKQQGIWVWREKDGDVHEGPIVEDKRHGQWVRRKKDGSVEDKFYVEGKIVGSNAETGVMEEGLLVNGKMHGNWILRGTGGSVEEGPYVDGRRHGGWTIRGADGNVWEGTFAEGQRHGHWVQRSKSGYVTEGPYVEGKRHGQWAWRDKNGSVNEKMSVCRGQANTAHWTSFRDRDGSVNEEGPYVEGKKHGDWVDQKFESAIGNHLWD